MVKSSDTIKLEKGNTRSNNLNMAKENPKVFVPQQFVNPANPQIHRSQTAIEILEDVRKNLLLTR